MNLRQLSMAIGLSCSLIAQRPGDPEEFVHLEQVLQAALDRAGPFVVTVETFGGTRLTLGKDGPIDGPTPPKRRPKIPEDIPEHKPRQPKPEPKPVPLLPKPGEEEEEAPKEAEPAPMPPIPKPELPESDKEKKKKKAGLVAKGFQQSQGKTSGIVLTENGWILISRFALNYDPTTILIRVPGRGTFHAQRGGEDTSRGIALVKIDAEGLAVPEFVHPRDVKVGQWAFALGRTFASDDPTVHLGIVSAKRRLFGRALQIDAYTSPANYGGAVVDIHGRVLGIAVPLSPSGRNAGVEWYDSGIGFATTIADIMPLMDRMKDGEILQRGWLGVQLSNTHLGPGAKITATPKNGAAAQAGLRKGDIILEVDGIEVMNGPHFQMLVSSRLGGDFCAFLVKKKFEDEPVRIGPLPLLDAPWSQQRKGKEDLPATFSLPEGEGR